MENSCFPKQEKHSASSGCSCVSHPAPSLLSPETRAVRWEGARAGARVPCGGPAGWASGASAHGRCRWVVRTGHTPACGGTLLRGLPAPAIPVCPARPSCRGSPGPRRGPSGPQGSVSHAGVPASGATTQPSRSQSSRLGPVTPGLRCCPAACRTPHSGSSALLVRTQAPDPGTARAQGSLSLTRQLAGAAPPEASLGDTKGGPHARSDPRSDPRSLLSAGSPRRSPTGRSPRRRRRRCTWSRSTRSPGSPSASSRSWWRCRERSTSTSGWPATVRGRARGGAGAGRQGAAVSGVRPRGRQRRGRGEAAARAGAGSCHPTRRASPGAGLRATPGHLPWGWSPLGRRFSEGRGL